MKEVSLGCLTFLILALCLAPFEIPRAIILGWLLFLVRTLPRMTLDWPSVFIGCLALVLFTAGLHWAGRTWRRTVPEAPPWKLRWSLAVVAAVFLLFAAGISLVGIVHQTGWLLTSRQPTYVQTIRSGWPGESHNHLKQIGLAVSNYQDVYRGFPPGGTFTPQGQMLHSWETHILWLFPYSTAEIDFKLPWDHPRNAKYFQCIIPQFINCGLASPPLFDERGFGLSHYAANVRVLGPDTKVRLEDIHDGASNTLLVGEVNAEFKPWGHPVNWRDPAKGINRSPYGFGGSPYAGGAYFSMADGSVRFVSERIDPKILQALSTPAGGEEIDASVLGSSR